MTSAEMVVVGMKHIVCFSGGHSSAIAAVEIVRKYGAEGTVLLNHDLRPCTEDADIKRQSRLLKRVVDMLVLRWITIIILLRTNVFLKKAIPPNKHFATQKTIDIMETV